MLLDTDFLIWCSRGNPKALIGLDGFEDIYVSAITHIELIHKVLETKKNLLY